MKPFRIATRAKQDFVFAHAYYLETGSAMLARQFSDALDVAIQRIQTFPESGSPRLATQYKIPGLRATYLSKFASWVIHYRNATDELVIVRILNSRQNIDQEHLSDA